MIDANHELEIEIPPYVTIPDDDSKELYGIDPVTIYYEDVTNDYAWYRLAFNHSWELESYDFYDQELYEKYWFLSLGLLEFPLMFIGGERGGGKSLFMAYYTYKMVTLFNKIATLDWTPRERDIFGKYNKLFDESYQNQIIDEYNRLARLEQEIGGDAPPDELEKLITRNAVFGLDECDGYADRLNQNNLTKVLAMIARRARHTYTCMSMVMVNIDRFAPVLQELCTHKVYCIKNGHFYGKVSICVEDVRKGGTRARKWTFLDPKDWLPLWRSHAATSMIHNHDISFGRKKAKKVDKGDIV